MAMATEKCNVSFQIRYTSSIPATGASAVLRYRIKNSTGSYAQYNITSVPNGGSIEIPNFQASDDYEYILDLTANGVTARKTDFFYVGKCIPPYCEIPDIKRVYLGEEDRIIMEYPVDETGLYAIEYQIATDDIFTKIVHVRVIMGSDYTPIEYIEMNDGTITNETTYFIRARRHCSPSVVSAWSNVVSFRSGKWAAVKAPYTFEDAYCVSGLFEDPLNVGEFKTSICWLERNPFMKTINLTTPKPEVMQSYIYLSDGITPATPENLSVFDTDEATGGPNIGFRERGIRWIRFGSQNPAQIYEVETSTGLITKISSLFNCYS
ncbi:hypothetical protein [Chryseobacterium scophthalmum]|uniref:hypothetical protein n=1 Tax=Chryseobacterium scophthalmum TaxID=59733 RepID=UPI003CFD8335